MTNEVKFEYIGKILNNTEVIEDKTNQLINIYFKNLNKKDIECWSFKKSEVEKISGRNILEKSKRFWINFFNVNTNKKESSTFLQLFPLDMWKNIIIPIKNGQESIIKIGMVK